MSDARITIEEAQAEIDALLVAEICRDFGINFDGVYPDHILARGVGPEQAFIGLAIKRGHLAVAAPADLYDAQATEIADLRRQLAEARADADLAVAEALRKAGEVAQRYADMNYAAMNYPEEAGMAASGTANEIDRDINSLANQDHLAEVQALRAERDGLLRAAHDNHEADKRAEAAEAEVARLMSVIDDVVCGRGMDGLDPAADLEWAVDTLAALTPKGDTP